YDDRKKIKARKEAINDADVVILCLPDEAAREAVALLKNTNTAIIDASTAHRTAPGWTYGFTEYDKSQREKIKSSQRVSNPGCYAVGAISIIHPLIASGLIE
ncbi:MAG TPA: N-acetyl-gamma-glutamyl-phosphate reductase, partial [Bacteroidetes bacterium]|nr:N-acetyl-gamma-glutamyl-phosphate reductase [Bacteroidota bacterium]